MHIYVFIPIYIYIYMHICIYLFYSYSYVFICQNVTYYCNILVYFYWFVQFWIDDKSLQRSQARTAPETPQSPRAQKHSPLLLGRELILIWKELGEKNGISFESYSWRTLQRRGKSKFNIDILHVFIIEINRIKRQLRWYHVSPRNTSNSEQCIQSYAKYVLMFLCDNSLMIRDLICYVLFCVIFDVTPLDLICDCSTEKYLLNRKNRLHILNNREAFYYYYYVPKVVFNWGQTTDL